MDYGCNLSWARQREERKCQEWFASFQQHYGGDKRLQGCAYQWAIPKITTKENYRS